MFVEAFIFGHVYILITVFQNFKKPYVKWSAHGLRSLGSWCLNQGYTLYIYIYNMYIAGYIYCQTPWLMSDLKN